MGVVEPSDCQHIAVSWTNLKHHHNCRHNHLIIDLENLKLVIDSHIGLVVKVGQGDVESVAAIRGELVELFETEPPLACNKL